MIIYHNDIYKTICYFVIFNPFLMSVCVQVRSALNVVSQLCSQGSVSESPSLLCGVDMMSVIFTLHITNKPHLRLHLMVFT